MCFIVSTRRQAPREYPSDISKCHDTLKIAVRNVDADVLF